MDSTEARARLQDLVRGGNVNPIRQHPDRSRNFAYLAESGKHKHMTDLDWAHLLIYSEAVLRTGSLWEAAAIRLSDGLFLEMDRAKIGAAITDKLIESANPEGTILRLSRDGWSALVKRLTK